MHFLLGLLGATSFFLLVCIRSNFYLLCWCRFKWLRLLIKHWGYWSWGWFYIVSKWSDIFCIVTMSIDTFLWLQKLYIRGRWLILTLMVWIRLRADRLMWLLSIHLNANMKFINLFILYVIKLNKLNYSSIYR